MGQESGSLIAMLEIARCSRCIGSRFGMAVDSHGIGDPSYKPIQVSDAADVVECDEVHADTANAVVVEAPCILLFGGRVIVNFSLVFDRDALVFPEDVGSWRFVPHQASLGRCRHERGVQLCSLQSVQAVILRHCQH
ncbi:MAG: hypothetical protein PUD09_09195, partial [Coriobacteriales bacterium]|nr:hypothetical protein [Coriobacteriales bacterium]